MCVCACITIIIIIIIIIVIIILLFLTLIHTHLVDCDEQKIRSVILEILNRLPMNEVLKPFIPNLLRLTMEILSIGQSFSQSVSE